jgi:prepilin-type N-terminal cleavage/methylation domain-containing protein
MRGCESHHGDGFTLIEAMTSVAIIAILAASAMPGYQASWNSEIRSTTESIVCLCRAKRGHKEMRSLALPSPREGSQLDG